MADRSAIEWTDATFNPWIGCTKVSPACDHCYAERSTPARAGGIAWGPGMPRRRTSAPNWKLPLRWNRERFMECGACGWRGECAAELIGCGSCGSVDAMNDARRRVFCASLADVFDNEVPYSWRADLFGLIQATPNIDWLLLTKRIGNATAMMDEAGGWSSADPHGVRNPLPNIWLGATIANQAEADRDIPKLLKTPASVRFLSMEPLLGPVDLRLHFFGHCPIHDFPGGFCLQRDHAGVQHLHWVIAGGESGPGARPMHPDWARSLRDQCSAAGVPFFFKQWGEWAPALTGMWFHPMQDMPHFTARAGGRDTHDFGGGLGAVRIGKRAAGRLLDGREHNDYPREDVPA